VIGFDEALRLARIQERVRTATYHEMRKDGHHKSSEGNVSLALNLPPVVGDDRDPYWSLEVYSYLLCTNGRSETWIGKTAAEVISKAEDGVEKWCFRSEMEMLEERMGGAADGEPRDGVPGDDGEVPF